MTNDAEFVEFRVYSGGNCATFREGEGRLRDQGCGDGTAEVIENVEAGMR